VELAPRREMDAELEALQTLVVWVQDLVLDNADGPSSLAASLSTVVELLEGQVNAAATNGVRYRTQSALVAALLHFLLLDAELELLMSERNADLTEDQVDAFWARVRATSDSLASHVLPSIACNPPDGAGK
jgi:hypothetical protein